MIELDKKARRLVYTPGNPAVWGSSDTWTSGKTFDCSYNRNTAERNVRAGRDSAQVSITLYYRPSQIKFTQSDRIAFDATIFEIMYQHQDSGGDDLNYVELRPI
jgi:hypothetical protein